MYENSVRVLCLLVVTMVVSVLGDPDFNGKGQQPQSIRPYYDRPFRRHHHHKYHHEALLHYYAWGAVATLVIIKILLAISFSGMVGGLMHMFAGIKYLLKEKEVVPVAPAPQPVILPHYHHDPHSHEYHSHEYPYAAHDHYQRRKQVYTGARGLGKDEPGEGYSPNEIKQRRKRNLKKLLNTDVKPIPQKRTARSAEEEVEPDNCKMKVACQLHARAKLSPFHTFQLYFLRKDGLAQYWDHRDRKFDECATVYPCGPNRQSIKPVEEKHVDTKDTPLPSITKVTDQRRQFNTNSDSGSYSVEYETQFSQPSGSAQTYDYSGSY